MLSNKDALIMAAGMGTRMLPLTKNCAKPLIPLCGTTMIETIITALIERGIGRIFVVVGYKSEQFSFLTKKYSRITIIENAEYQHKNNISSLYAAADYIGKNDCFICEADLFISDGSIFEGATDSCYFGRYVGGYSSDWVFETKNGFITRVGKGGSNLYNMVGVSHFRAADIRALVDAVRSAYKSAGHENLFWDEVVNANLDSLRLTIKPVTSCQIAELDTVAELEQFVLERAK